MLSTHGYPLQTSRNQNKRADYQAMLDDGLAPDSPRANALLTEAANLASVNPKLITDPLTPAQINKANAWKIAYLQRLRSEKADESYISAYLNAWNLSPASIGQQ
jgi:hypothetical protein